jgi:NADH:ubiquinone oxidoreductase subunit
MGPDVSGLADHRPLGHITFVAAPTLEAPMYFLKRLLTWWNGQTLGTQIFTARKGVKVGEDAQGNIYYQTRDGKRRWVIYNGEVEASRVSPDWHGWLHHTWDEPPTKAPLVHKAWEKPHLENLTGSEAAYAPPGSIRGAVPLARRDYEAWQPE